MSTSNHQIASALAVIYNETPPDRSSHGRRECIPSAWCPSTLWGLVETSFIRSGRPEPK